MSKKNQWLTVEDLIDILKHLPKDAMIVVNNNYMYDEGTYYATRDSIHFYNCEPEKQVEIGTNYNTLAME